MNRKLSYYRIEYRAESAFSIGAADSVLTDHDVVLDSRGLPVIPATSLSGVYRSFFDGERAEQLFGTMLNESGELSESLIRVYDATWMGGNRLISTRDNVSLENKVAKPGLKFDRQVVEPGAEFLSFIEVRNAEVCPHSEILQLLTAIDSGILMLGSKTTRGLGRMRITSCLHREFNLSNPLDRASWLDFDMFGETSWDDGICENIQTQIEDSANDLNHPSLFISLDLQQCGAISIREYSTEPDRPDFGQLYIRSLPDDGTDTPVIPGTSWAGAFRERYKAFAGDTLTKELFGFVEKTDAADVLQTITRKSRISFSESTIQGGSWKEITRNSIDRFTGGTKDGALFTMRTYYNGSTRLSITVNRFDELSNQTIKPLLAVLADLHNGFLAVGGLTSIGHGMFRIVGARMAVNRQEYVGFYEKLVGKDGDGFAQPDIEAMADEINCLASIEYLKGDRNE